MGTRTTVATLLLAGALGAQTNTLLIVGDDMGVDTVGIYKEGASPAPTPNIDKLAKNGVLFRNAYAGPWCSVTRAHLMTGRHGFRTGVGRAGQTLPLTETTLPEILPSTYTHALIGKWHLGGSRPANNHPNQTGWGHFAGSLGGFFTSPETYYSWKKVVNSKSSTSTNYATSDNVDDSIAWIKAQKGAWVCSLNFNAPHAPYHAPPSSLHSYDLTNKNPRQDRVLFFKAMIEAMDTEIGRLLAGIDSATLARTNVIFVGDNGTGSAVTEAPFINSHAKTTLYEGGTNVPLIVSGPGVQSPGREVAALVHSTDLFDTIAEWSGVNARNAVNAEIDGVSIVPYLQNPKQEPLREMVYTETFGSSRFAGTAVRNAGYKLIRPQTGGDKLFDLTIDPFEKTDLLLGTLTKEQRENYDRLASELARLKDEAAWFVFGTACSGNPKTPKFAASAGQRPLLGQTFTTEVTDLNTGVTVNLGMLGLSRTKYGTIPLPLDLTAIGAPGCTLYLSLDILVPLLVTGGKATWNFPIPSVTALNGLRFYQQVGVFETSVNTLKMIFTNAGEGCIEIK
ncbi:MAG: sulfatase-like hydrolase/transferase [Planctomycetota bacterium]|jgi:arylsulfatase A-like enzyme|nr:sulfatase-like hydrolase/transferase [Planctomycetota bacterium]